MENHQNCGNHKKNHEHLHRVDGFLKTVIVISLLVAFGLIGFGAWLSMRVMENYSVLA